MDMARTSFEKRLTRRDDIQNKLDDITQRMADKWGYKDEDLAQLYNE